MYCKADIFLHIVSNAKHLTVSLPTPGIETFALCTFCPDVPRRTIAMT